MAWKEAMLWTSSPRLKGRGRPQWLPWWATAWHSLSTRLRGWLREEKFFAECDVRHDQEISSCTSGKKGVSLWGPLLSPRPLWTCGIVIQGTKWDPLMGFVGGVKTVLGLREDSHCKSGRWAGMRLLKEPQHLSMLSVPRLDGGRMGKQRGSRNSAQQNKQPHA